MIRPTTPDDSEAVIALAVAAGLFPEGEAGVVEEALAGASGGGMAGDGPAFVIDEEGGEPVGVAYYAPAPAADRTWYLTMIAVRPDHQGKGRGSALVRHVEDALREAGQRLLLVETSGLEAFGRTRAFYAKCGFEEEARVRDFYKQGEDMVLFRKALEVG